MIGFRADNLMGLSRIASELKSLQDCQWTESTVLFDWFFQTSKQKRRKYVQSNVIKGRPALVSSDTASATLAKQQWPVPRTRYISFVCRLTLHSTCYYSSQLWDDFDGVFDKTVFQVFTQTIGLAPTYNQQ